MQESKVSVADMERRVCRIDDVQGGMLSFLDQRMPGHEREIINILGMAVAENPAALELQPKIAAPAYGFAITMVRADPGKGAALHVHPTEEVSTPITERWAIFWLEGGVEREITVGPGDTISVPVGIYRGFRNVSDAPALLHAVIGGPDTGKVLWHSSVIDGARATGLEIDAEGNLREVEATR
ncbi:MAG: cupin domain-containing protein [Alphaproteobacteria bacterium]|nr:cupin domain-containing protein [Alphaproteobacteria bacterium]